MVGESLAFNEFSQILGINLWEMLDILGTRLRLRDDRVSTSDRDNSFLGSFNIYKEVNIQSL